MKIKVESAILTRRDCTGNVIDPEILKMVKPYFRIESNSEGSIG